MTQKVGAHRLDEVPLARLLAGLAESPKRLAQRGLVFVEDLAPGRVDADQTSAKCVEVTDAHGHVVVDSLWPARNPTSEAFARAFWAASRTSSSSSTSRVSSK